MFTNTAVSGDVCNDVILMLQFLEVVWQLILGVLVMLYIVLLEIQRTF